MTDMGPRRMDGFARPVGTPGSRSQPQPSARPVGVPQRPQPLAAPQSRPMPRPVPPRHQPSQAQPQPQPQAAAQQPKPERSGGGAWRVVLQFVVGLAVIAGVAAAIVALYIRYYQ